MRKNSKLYLIIVAFLILVAIGGVLFCKSRNQSKKSEKTRELIVNEIKKESLTKLDADIKVEEIIVSVKDGKIENLEELNDYPFYKDLEIADKCEKLQLSSIFVKSDQNVSEYNKLNNYVLSCGNIENEKSAKIAFSKEEKPIRDYFISSENNKKSTINGVDLEVYQIGTSYMVIFKYDGINFDIETINFTETELISLLKSIIK